MKYFKEDLSRLVKEDKSKISEECSNFSIITWKDSLTVLCFMQQRTLSDWVWLNVVKVKSTLYDNCTITVLQSIQPT